MIIYKDSLNGDELLSDTFPLKIVGQNKCFITARGKNITRKEGTFDTGANPSQEEAPEETDDSVVSGVDLVMNHRLTEISPYKKKDYQAKLKSYLANLRTKKNEMIAELKEEKRTAEAEKVEEEMKRFLEEFQADLKEVILTDFKAKKFQFFLGETLDDDNGMICLMNYPEDDPEQRPIMYYIKFGLEEEKV